LVFRFERKKRIDPIQFSPYSFHRRNPSHINLLGDSPNTPNVVLGRIRVEQMTSLLDDTDRKILELLQRDARLTNAAIGEAVGLSAPSVFERVRKLEQKGVIEGYTVKVNPAAVGRPLTAFIRLTLAYDEKHEAGLRAISQDPDVLEAYDIAGEDCLIVKTCAASPEALQALLGRIRTHVTVQRSVTMIAMSKLKENGPLNVTEPSPPAHPRSNGAPFVSEKGKGR
jgi:Lrp/AsnC family leucine-responsive transcriptional regulator